MLGLLVTLKAKPGKEKDVERVLGEVSSWIRANEPGTLLYQLTKSRTEASTYKILELFADDAAYAAHGKAPNLLEAEQQLMALFDGAPDLEYVDGVG